jgi:hypothetical protein
MDNWVYSRNRKKHQRKINSYVKKINKNIENDNLWKGRFYIHQVNCPQAAYYEDGSGMEYYVWLRFEDRKTGRYFEQLDSTNGWCHWNGYRLWDIMNWFIVEYIRV